MPRLKQLLLVIPLLSGLPLRADWKQDVGYDRLQATFTTGVPDTVTAGITQVEAGPDGDPTNSYLPTATNTQFTGKDITNRSSGSGTSAHATSVGGYYYGNTNSLVSGTTQIDAYNTTGWLSTDFLQANGGLPAGESRLVQNHSWVGSVSELTDSEGNVIYTIDDVITLYDLRLDYAVKNSGFICVAGVKNSTGTTLPHLLANAYNLITVGRSDGVHSAGFTTYDGTGRIKPDIVSPASVTSYSTPQVASAAGLLGQKLLDAPYSLTGEAVPRTTKALLLAGATKEEFSTWSNTSARPLDIRYGAGELNILLSYRILSGGSQSYSSSSTAPDTAWSHSSVQNGQSRSYFFEIPEGSHTQRFSAALIWHRNVTVANSTISYSLADLNLQLYTATGFVRGASVTDSSSTVDNVEHIYQASLAPGRYELVVSAGGTGPTSTSYALAWRTSPTVTVAATIDTADELTGGSAVFTLTRTGPVTSPLVVPLSVGGSAVSGVHYTALPVTATIPAGQSSVTVAVTPITDDIAQGDRSVTLTVATDYSLSAGAASSAAITIQDKPYDAWRFSRFSTAQLANETISGADADPDADGIANLVEYALATEPLSPDSSDVLPQPVVTDDHLAITYHPLRAELVYTPQWSPDLAGWFSGAAHTTETTEAGIVTSTAITPLSEQPRQFLRLQIANP